MLVFYFNYYIAYRSCLLSGPSGTAAFCSRIPNLTSRLFFKALQVWRRITGKMAADAAPGYNCVLSQNAIVTWRDISSVYGSTWQKKAVRSRLCSYNLDSYAGLNQRIGRCM